jgi:hypothetical protein
MAKVVKFVGNELKNAGDAIGNEIRNAGAAVDDFVREEIPGGWGTVAVVGGGAYLASTAGAGAAAGSGAAAGTGAVVTPVASWGGTVTPIAPISTAVAIPASQLAFPATEIGAISTPVPGSLQAALPSLGVETAASAAPFTAAPGSFQAAIGSGLLASAAPALSLTDAFRTARLASNLMGQPQQPQPQRQELPGLQASGVDVLTLPQLSARTPGIANLLSPANVNVLPKFDLVTGEALLPSRSLSLLG